MDQYLPNNYLPNNYGLSNNGGSGGIPSLALNPVTRQTPQVGNQNSWFNGNQQNGNNQSFNPMNFGGNNQGNNNQQSWGSNTTLPMGIQALGTLGNAYDQMFGGNNSRTQLNNYSQDYQNKFSDAASRNIANQGTVLQDTTDNANELASRAAPVLKGEKQSITDYQNQMNPIMQGYQNRYNTVMGNIQGYGQSQLGQINRSFDQQASSALSGADSRGFGNSTVASDLQRGVNYDRQNSLAQANQNINSTLAQYGSNLSGDALTAGVNNANQQATLRQNALTADTNFNNNLYSARQATPTAIQAATYSYPSSTQLANVAGALGQSSRGGGNGFGGFLGNLGKGVYQLGSSLFG